MGRFISLVKANSLISTLIYAKNAPRVMALILNPHFSSSDALNNPIHPSGPSTPNTIARGSYANEDNTFLISCKTTPPAATAQSRWMRPRTIRHLARLPTGSRGLSSRNRPVFSGRINRAARERRLSDGREVAYAAPDLLMTEREG